jgi:hypothetical protein
MELEGWSVVWTWRLGWAASWVKRSGAFCNSAGIEIMMIEPPGLLNSLMSLLRLGFVFSGNECLRAWADVQFGNVCVVPALAS